MAMKNDVPSCTNMHSCDYTQERDQQYCLMYMLFIPPDNTEKWFFSPVSIVIFCKNTRFLMNKIVMTCEIATAESIVDETYRGPGNVFKWNEIAWLCSLNLTQTQYFVKEYKTLVSLPLNAICIMLEGDSSEHISGNCWTWWVSPHC